MKKLDKKQPQVTVVMPLYNNEKYVQEAVLSVQRQIYQHWELIVVDDASSDKSYELVRRMAKGDKRIRLYRNRKNLGIGETMNILLTLTRGEYIARMDSDDIMLPTRLSTQVAYMENNPKVGIVGSYLAEINSERRLTAVRKVPIEHNQIVQGLLTRQTIQNPTLMMRVRSIPKSELYFDGTLSPADDLEFYLRMSRKGVQFANIPEYLMYYRAHGANSSLFDIKKSYALTKRARAQGLGKSKVRISFKQSLTSALQDIVVTLLPNKALYSIYKLWQGSGVRGDVIPTTLPKREYSVSLVMPVYKGEHLIKESIERVVSAMRSLLRPFELVVVVDGEVDKTLQIANKMRDKYSELQVISYLQNMGKGYAVRKGLESAKSEYFGYIDAGHDIDTNAIVEMIESVSNLPRTDVLAADKTHPMSQIINVPYYRKVYSVIFRKLVKILFGKKMGDTQVGMKLFRRDAIMSLINDLKIDGFAFDVELMKIFVAKGKNIAHLPVTIRKNGEVSTVTKGDMVRSLGDIVKIKIDDIARVMVLHKNRFVYSIMEG